MNSNYPVEQMGQTNFQELLENCLPVVQGMISAQNRFSQPYRDRFEHTLRVLTWARRIQQVEGGDRAVVEIAVMFHDVGWDEDINHAQVGADLAQQYLTSQGVEPGLVERICHAVRTHNLRRMDLGAIPIENKIVMDADMLDELGVTTLVWDALAVGSESSPSYRKVFERDRKYYLHAKQRVIYLKTRTGKKLYRDRLRLWSKVLKSLAFELNLDEPEGDPGNNPTN